MRTRILLAVVLIATASTAAHALDSGAARCRRYLAGKTQSIATLTLSSEVACHRARMLGEIAAVADCANLDDALFPASDRAKVRDHVAMFIASAAARCTGSTSAALGYTSCAAPCDTRVPALTTMTEVAECLSCLAEHHASVAIGSLYGATPPVTSSRNEAWRCQNVYAGRGSYSYARSRGKKQRSCQFNVDRGVLTGIDCKLADLSGSIARAESRLGARIASCSESDLAALTSCGASVAAEQACAATAIEAMTDTLFGLIYPSPAPTPTAAATSTRTSTGTPSPTPTSTPTTAAGDCPSASFLDVSLAPGPGASYPDPTLSVSCTATQVVVSSNSLPHYTFVQTTPNALRADNTTMRFPRSPAVAASTTAIPLLGKIAVAVNGVQIYGPNEAATPDPYGDPVANAILDECVGHTSPGAYHYHALYVKCLNLASLVAEPWDNPDPSPSERSPIIAYAFDGFPIYGPYECSDASCSSMVEMLSGWDNIGYQSLDCTSTAQCSGNYTCAKVSVAGAKRKACVPKTYVWNNNQYVSKAGPQYLDQCNGHYGPGGDYHYHATETFPYILGCYRGTPTAN